MKEYIVGILVFLFIIMLPISCKVYKYKECKKVGHSTFYCMTSKV